MLWRNRHKRLTLRTPKNARSCKYLPSVHNWGMPSLMETSLASRLALITANVQKAALAAGRPLESVRLLGVTKGHDIEAVKALVVLGQTRFAENRVQEAQLKYTQLKQQNQLELHLIGPLQSNKAKAAVELFDFIHSVDRPSLVTALASAMAVTGKKPRFLVQVNIGREPQKAGVLPEALPELLAVCAKADLLVEGLMCIPPEGQNPVPYFTELASLAAAHNLPELSMGMSGDYELAVATGATYIRVGSALLGAR